jgi:LmbE family N-acetylglucosaminyl deacetylase
MQRFVVVATAALALLVAATAAYARDAAELQLAIRKLSVTGSALYVAAHPDDENTAMLAWLANGRLYRAGYLSVTRGDGGQNLIGEEKGALLGLIRTQELLAARRIDGAEQMFTRAVDFGYSKSPEETLRIWGHDAVLSDVVWAIRRFQPEVIVTRFPVTGEGGHGQHTASAILAEEAFAAAGDPTRFPEQLRHVAVWQPRRIFFNRFSWRPIDPDDPSLAGSLRIDLGAYNPLLGRAYTEIAAVSRSEHKSQGFGAAERRGTIINYFDQRGGDPAQAELFEGIDTTWSRYPGGEKLGALLTRTADEFDPDNPSASIPLLMQALNLTDQMRADPAWSDREKPWFAARRRELLEVIRDCAGIAIDVAAADSSVTPGSDVTVAVSVVNRSNAPFRLSMVTSPYAAPGKAPGTRLENNKPVRTEITLRIPADAAVSQPYWLRQPSSAGLFSVEDPLLVGVSENPPAIPIIVSLEDSWMNTLIFTVPAVFRWTDPVQGGKVRSVDVVPAVTANFGSGVYLFPDAQPRPVSVRLRAFAPVEGELRLRLPAGWKSEPASLPVSFAAKGEEQQITFRITPSAAETTSNIVAEVRLASGSTLALAITEIDYPHIPAQRLFGESSARVVRANIARRGKTVGYIMGSGDEIPGILRQVGYEVTLLTDDDLDQGDFARFDAIVTGIRAYNTRRRLRAAHAHLMDYVANGGTMVVQYNTLDDLAVSAPGPFPFTISRDRVSVEEAPVRLLDPSHFLLTRPNRITAADFEGWVQERGLYFPGKWDPRYATVIASSDPGEPPLPGGQLVARHGKGVFVYSAYAWWRQLPAGVPGAIKAFVNLVSAN